MAQVSLGFALADTVTRMHIPKERADTEAPPAPPADPDIMVTSDQAELELDTRTAEGVGGMKMERDRFADQEAGIKNHEAGSSSAPHCEADPPDLLPMLFVGLYWIIELLAMTGLLGSTMRHLNVAKDGRSWLIWLSAISLLGLIALIRISLRKQSKASSDVVPAGTELLGEEEACDDWEELEKAELGESTRDTSLGDESEHERLLQGRLAGLSKMRYEIQGRAATAKGHPW